MSKLINFSFSKADISVIMIDNNPWFIAKEICDILELTNPTMALQSLDDDERAKLNLGRQGDANIINESGLYTLILRCKNAIKQGTPAYKFRKWVTNEVLPTIRKTGSYSVTPSQPVTIDGYMDRELRNQMMDIVRYFRNSSNQVSAKLWEMIKSQLHIQRITDMSRNDYPAVIDWLKNFQTAAYQNYLRECDVENQLIKVAAAIRLENLQEFNQIQEKIKKNAKVLTLL